jgi:hypothetical protein
MNFLPGFLVRILKAAAHAEEGREKMFIVVRRPYAYLQAELRQGFEGQGDVHVLVDRRSGNRRAGQEAVTVKRRQADRRRAQQEIVEVVISG